MARTNSKNDSPKGEEESKRKFSQSQYDMLMRCSDKKDMTEWNEWRKNNPGEDVLLEKAYLEGFHLQGAVLVRANLQGSVLCGANLQGADLRGANLQGADLKDARLNCANFNGAYLKKANLNAAWIMEATFDHTNLEEATLKFAHLEGANLMDARLGHASLSRTYLQGTTLETVVVDGYTSFCYCAIDKNTNFLGVGLDSMRVDPWNKQLLEYNVRRMTWEKWYKWIDWQERVPKKERRKLSQAFRQLVRLFWSISDYGRSTERVIWWFFWFAAIFAAVYRLCPDCVVVGGEVGGLNSLLHAFYFSVVTMTTLGFGDIYANPDSSAGQIILMVQVILGYMLLGALVTRFAVLFTAGGPAGRFVPMDEETSKRLSKIESGRSVAYQGDLKYQRNH